MNVLLALGVLGLLILVHESGHFLAATSQGIRVNGFSIGFGPAIFKKELKGVTYALRALPLGGFVSFPDDDEKSNIPSDDPDLLKNRPLAQRALVISAGVLANLLLAWVVLVSQAAFFGLPDEPEQGVMVVAVQKNEAADIAGITAGDQILKVNGISLGKGAEAVQALVEKIKTAPGIPLKIEKIQGEKEISLTLIPNDNGGTGKVGAQLQANISGTFRSANNFSEIINHADKQFFDLLTKTIQGYKGLITDFGATAKQVSGPVKIVEMGAQLTEQGSAGIILFMALISINLAVLNSLPMPLLDGGQMMLLFLEGIRGKPIPEKFQLIFMQSGFLLLLGLSLLLIIRDTSQLSMVQELMGH